MKAGDRVKITDGSYAVRVDKYEGEVYIGLCNDIFEIVNTELDNHISYIGTTVHDVFIQNTVDKKIYLHSIAFLKLFPPKVKELTISDIEQRYGCRVKIIK